MIADTARLMVELTMKDELSGPANRARSEVASLGSAGSATAGHIGVLGKAATGAGNAFGHLKGRVSELGSGLLALGGVGGLLGVGAVLESSVHKVEDFGAALEKVTTLTGESALASGALILQFQKFGLGADRVVQVVGFTEKTLGKLAETMTGKGAAATSKLAELDAKFGLQLVDSSGRVADFSTTLEQLATFYDSSASASTKAFVASQVFGRGYTTMIPILAEGSAGLRQAAADAASLGLNSADTVEQLAKFHDEMHLLEQQVNLLQLGIGTALLPTLIDLSTAATDFVSGHRADIARFFRDAANAAKTAVGALVDFGGQVAAVWNSIPPEFRDLLVKGVVADRTVKFLFGFSPIGAAFSGLESAITNAVGRGVASSIVGAGLGKAFVQPVWVTNPGFGTGGPSLPAGAAAAGGEGLLASLGITGASMTVLGAGLAATIVAALVTDKAINDKFGGWEGLGRSVRSQALANPGQGVPTLGGSVAVADPSLPTGRTVFLGGKGGSIAIVGTGGATAMGPERDSRPYRPLAELAAASARAAMGVTGRAGGDSRPYGLSNGQVLTLARALDQLHQDLQAQLHVLRKSADPHAVAAAATRIAGDVERGAGGVAFTRSLIATLQRDRGLVAASGSKSDLAAVDAAIRLVAGKLPNRVWVEEQLAQAKRVADSAESSDRKQADLKRIQQLLLSHSDSAAARTVGQLAQIAAKRTDVSVTVPVTINQTISSRDVYVAQLVRARGVHQTGMSAYP